MLVEKNISPGQGDVHVNRPLTNISVAYMQDESDFVAERVFPNIPVQKRADLYFEFPIGEFNRDEMRERAPGTETPGGGYEVSTDPYYARVFGLHKDIDDQILANYDSPLSADTEATNWLSMQGMMQKERRWQDTYFKTDVWTLEVQGGSARTGALDWTHASNNELQYWNQAGADPIENIREGKREMQARTGFRPNILTLGRPVYDALVDHGDIIGRLDRGQTSGIAMTNREQLAALFELDQVLVMDAVFNAAAQGEAAAMSFVGGKGALLSYRPASPGLMTPSAGYHFGWAGYLGAAQNGVRMKRFRWEAVNANRVEIESAYDFRLISAAMGVFFKDIVQ